MTGCRHEIGKFGPFNREVTDEDFLKHTNTRVTNIKKKKKAERERKKESKVHKSEAHNSSVPQKPREQIAQVVGVPLSCRMLESIFHLRGPDARSR